MRQVAPDDFDRFRSSAPASYIRRHAEAEAYGRNRFQIKPGRAKADCRGWRSWRGFAFRPDGSGRCAAGKEEEADSRCGADRDDGKRSLRRRGNAGTPAPAHCGARCDAAHPAALHQRGPGRRSAVGRLLLPALGKDSGKPAEYGFLCGIGCRMVGIPPRGPQGKMVCPRRSGRWHPLVAHGGVNRESPCGNHPGSEAGDGFLPESRQAEPGGGWSAFSGDAV